MIEAEFRTRTRSLIEQLALAKIEAGNLGLWGTVAAIDKATTKIGWEVAGEIRRLFPRR